MKDINWSQLEKNSESKELGFEHYCFQIAYNEYSSLGHFDYYYNTPGSEFYLTLEKDSNEFNLKVGDVIGWQAKFWRGNADEENSPLDQNHRSELIEGFKKTIEYKPNIKKWIICTPGKFSNTAPNKAVEKLEAELTKIKPDSSVDYWHKDIFLTFALKNIEFYGALFNHFFSTKFIGFEYFKCYSEKRLDRLRDKFDIDLYVENEIDEDISYILDPNKTKEKLQSILIKAKRFIKNKENDIDQEPNEYKVIDSRYIANVKKLLESRCELVEDIFNCIQEVFDAHLIKKIIEDHRADLKKIVDDLNQKLKDKSYFLIDEDKVPEYNHELYIHNSLFNFVQEISSYIFNYVENDAENIEYYTNLSLSSHLHIFGSAGYGKTNLACAICKKHLEKGIPALLILGSNIRDSFTPQEQIVNSLDLKNEFTFKELLFSLNYFGQIKKCRIPIIIDGLNESTPTTKIWKESLPDIIHDIKYFKNLFLITTLREGYVTPIFGKSSYREVENYYKIDGFSNNTIKPAIKMYFQKYRISVKKQFDSNLFKNPLLLKMYCMANEGSENAIVSSFGIYKSIQNYITTLSVKISDGDPLKKKKVLKGLENISKKLWENNSRTILYPEDYTSLIEENIVTFQNSISYAMMDEGMFFLRNFNEEKEEIQFTYDLIAGYCIAKYYLLKEKSEIDILAFFHSEDYAKISQTSNKHPLAEDILKAIFYLIPLICGKKLSQISGIKLNTLDLISNIDIIFQKGEDKDLLSIFESLSLNENEIEILCEKIHTEIIERNSFANVDILYTCYLNWSNYQRDIHWNEKTRKDVWKILDILKKISKPKYLNELSEQDVYEHFIYCILLFSSTDNALRNTATRTAIFISEINHELILTILAKSHKITDVYILERIVAVLCGVILRIKNKTFTINCCDYLQDIFLPNTSTNHVVILDYIETIFRFANSHYKIPYSPKILLRNKQEIWRKEKAYEAKLSKKKYYDMGIDIFDYDFTKYQISPLIESGKIKMSYIDIFSKLHYRCNLHGYTKEQYQELENILSKEQRYKRDEALDSRENYVYKYIWTAYYEYIGFLLANNIVEKENNSLFRINDIMIDPTFPQLPKKEQLINDSFLPSYKMDIQDWINSNNKSYLESIYCTILNGEDSDEWILLEANCTQENDQNKTKQRIHISVDAIIYKSDADLKEIESNRFHINTNGIYNIYAGELPWGNNVEFEENDNCSAKQCIMLSTKLYAFTSWSNMRSRLCESFPFLNKEIPLYLNLDFNPLDLSFYFGNEKVTKYIWAYGSQFYFIKKKYIKKYLDENELRILHHKFIAKYGDFGSSSRESIYDPSYKDVKANNEIQL